MTLTNATARIVSVGECMVEVAPGSAAGSCHMGFAGDTYNTAWYLRQISPAAQVSYVTGVGTDPLSGQLLDHMSAAGIDATHVHRTRDRTLGLYLISLDQGERSFSYWRDQSAARLLAQNAQRLDAGFEGAKLIYFSGITMAILNGPSRTRLLGALDRARATGSLIAFDPNLRPHLWTSGDEMREAITRAAAASDIVLPSFEDEAEHFGDESPEETLDRYSTGATRVVVVKNGSDPVYFRDTKHSGMVPVAPVREVIDSTSAGDSFNAGFLARIIDADPIETAIQTGSDIASQVVAARGALVALRRDDVMA